MSDQEKSASEGVRMKSADVQAVTGYHFELLGYELERGGSVSWVYEKDGKRVLVTPGGQVEAWSALAGQYVRAPHLEPSGLRLRNVLNRWQRHGRHQERDPR